jgi:hypothetical protein
VRARGREIGGPGEIACAAMPRSWIVLQALIVVFVLAGIVIAIVKM